MRDAPTNQDEKIAFLMAKAKGEDEALLLGLELALVETQTWLIEQGKKVIVILEGRDAAGKDGAIKTLVHRMSARNTRVVALPKPNDREVGQYYFQRYIAHFPTKGEFVIFNRSYYNRAGVEPVMGFCTPEQHEIFLKTVTNFEKNLAEEDVILLKYFVTISQKEQQERLKERFSNPLKALKISPLDSKADEKWADYSKAFVTLFEKTDHKAAPWSIVRGNNKTKAQYALMADIVTRLDPPNLSEAAKKSVRAAIDPARVFPFEKKALADGRIDL